MFLFISRYQKVIAWFFATLAYVQLVLTPLAGRASTVQRQYTVRSENQMPGSFGQMTGAGDIQLEQNPVNTRFEITKSETQTAGPGQPEMQAFSSVNNANMVDLFSGDFSYNIPLMDVGGYPINLSYRSGISMDQEASWVGLGWNVNPGTINRNLRGLPDDFDGRNDSITKVMNIKENKTVGVTAGASGELAGLPIGLSASRGIFYNNYKGWGLETALNASINAGSKATGYLAGGLSLTDNTQEGFSISPSVSVYSTQQEKESASGIEGSFSLSLPYNSRAGLRGLQMSTGIRQFASDQKNQEASGVAYSSISFASPSFTPSITIPYTSRQFSFTAKTGTLIKVNDVNFFISGYVSSQTIAAKDTLLSLPAYGYLNFQEAQGNRTALLDYNLEKDLPYREKPPVPHIGIPSYTYDAFSISGEGTGGMFRAYRSDIGFVHDHAIRTRDNSDRLSLDFGGGDIVHAGVDLNINRAYTQNGPWTESNTINSLIDFRKDTATFEAAYLRNPAEKPMGSKNFFNAIGGDDLVAVKLFQPDRSSSFIQATNYLTRYQNKRANGEILLDKNSVVKPERDKRTQVISYLTAKEADVAGLSRYIESYSADTFALQSCGTETATEGNGTGLPGVYYAGTELEGEPIFRSTQTIFNFVDNFPLPETELYSARWVGRIKSNDPGTYTFQTQTDDGVRLWINDSLLINNWKEQGATYKEATVQLLGNEFYTIRLEYFQRKGQEVFGFRWREPGQGGFSFIPKENMYGPAATSFPVSNILVKEKRVNTFRKPNHISEITVLNNDGRRYVYGLPVYNLKQTEATFAIDTNNADKSTGLAGYNNDENSPRNTNGNDHFYKREETPAYAHSFLITGILSNDYVDISGNGISDDDLGDAVKFNYSKVAGIDNPFRWKTPYIDGKASYNEGLRTDRRDDKGNIIYGTKELWYLHSIESKSMVAFFKTANREDLLNLDINWNKTVTTPTKLLSEILLYSKSEFSKKGLNARPIKTVHFEYAYELTDGFNGETSEGQEAKLTLKKVWFTYNKNNKGQLNPYIFNYSNNPNFEHKAYDRWGNYKSSTQNPGSIPNDEYPYALQDSAVAAVNAGAWALDSIFLPSGGAIKVEYESDDYAFVQNKRAMNMVKPLGFASSPGLTAGFNNRLYNGSTDNLYIYFSISGVSDNDDFFRKYLEGINKLYFRLFVVMPGDIHGGGSEYVSGYADIDAVNGYGYSGSTGWVKVAGISLKGDGGGSYSPMVKAATQFLRLNLPSKAYPLSEPGDNLSASSAVKMVLATLPNMVNAFTSFDATARSNDWCSAVDLNKSYLRLNDPDFKKYGGGHRVKRIKIYDNWNRMVQRRGTVYGQEYTYTTVRDIAGVPTTISSGVASYEPGIGGEENPFRQPIEYIERASILAPTTLGYSEEPLGESFFPSASIGYSKVRVRNINHTNTRSANGFEETQFYTTYDFPTYAERTLLDPATKKRFAPGLANFLRINARHHIALSQGFKIELNDMNGKLRSHAVFAQTDERTPIRYTENVYKTENAALEHKRLSNHVSVINPAGVVDTNGIIGKDVELMMAMREQLSVNTGFNVNINADMFSIPFVPPFFILPSMLNLYQREENLFRSAATVKVIQRYGIMDSVIHIDKGSKVSTKDILYDSETGDVLLSRTQNEFNDPIYNFSYPSHWAYDGMGLAYKNINATFKHVKIKQGSIIDGLPNASEFLSSGDEILVGGKLQTTDGAVTCGDDFSSFASYTKLWAIDSSVLHGGTSRFFLIDRNGLPYNADDVTLKIVRSGRRNQLAAVGSMSSLVNPLIVDEGQLVLSPSATTQVLDAKSTEFNQLWRVADRKSRMLGTICAPDSTMECTGSECCACLKPFFDYLQSSRRLFIGQNQNITVGTLVSNANSAGAGINISSCPILDENSEKPFYALTTDSVGTFYRAKLGDCIISWSATETVNFNTIKSKTCSGSGVEYSLNGTGNLTDTLTVSSTKALTTFNIDPTASNPFPYGPNTGVINNSSKFTSGLLIPSGGAKPFPDFRIMSYMKFEGINSSAFPAGSVITSATLHLKASSAGFASPTYSNAHLPLPATGGDEPYGINIPVQDWDESSTYGDLSGNFVTFPQIIFGISNANQDLDLDISTFVEEWRTETNKGLRIFIPFGNDSNYVTFANHRDANSAKHPTVDVIYTVTDPTLAELSVESCSSCEPILAESCMSTMTDTIFNPYSAGVLGNWRVNKNYSYYGARAQANPSTLTNVRFDGAIADYASFWQFSNNKLTPDYDSTRWVWNSEMTLFNRKGFELENKDPLGRFNAGIYGYNLTMPIAVVQNARFRESGFDGFEDYDFVTQLCDTVCAVSRQMDFSNFSNLVDTLRHHSGKSSLRLGGGINDAALQFDLSDASADAQTPTINFTLGSVCSNTALESIKGSSGIVLPSFSPLKGKKMTLSAWVREDQDCKCSTYVNNKIIVAFDLGASVTMRPTGSIIEGWQRYEGVFDIPSNATQLFVTLQAENGVSVNFDDVRIHPFNANMKSFVFHPVNLRLMAELDENNYATFYEYDDDGTLIRLKKETERGIKTIKETRSALMKEQ